MVGRWTRKRSCTKAEAAPLDEDEEACRVALESRATEACAAVDPTVVIRFVRGFAMNPDVQPSLTEEER